MAQGRGARVLLVEDDAAVRSALEAALDQNGYVVRAEPDADAIGSVAHEFQPDLAILDVRLGGGADGYVAAKHLRAWSDLPLLFLSAADSLEDRLAGFDVGADDYIVKPFAMSEVLARIQVLLRRSPRLSSAVHEVGDLVVDDAAKVVVRGGERLELTATEYELLCVLAERPGQVVSKRSLLRELWGAHVHDPNLVEAHVSGLRRKLEHHGPRLIHTIRGLGYTLHA